MQSSPALSIGLPVALCIIMLGLGLSLRFEDFTRVLARPGPLIVGLVCQAILLPALCFALVYVSSLPPAICVGMMLLAASPGGTSAALFTHLARGDVALGLAMTAVGSLLAMATLPIVANLSLTTFYGEATAVRLEFRQVLQIFLIAIVPALIGAFIHGKHPALAKRMDRPVKLLATLFLAAVVLAALIGQWRLLATWGLSVGTLVLVFSLMSFGLGYFVPRMLGVDRRQAVALAMSTGVHNAALVIALAMSQYMLNNPEMAIPPAAYGLVAYIVGGFFVWALNRGAPA
ncbi:bile acid:sodium symporter family protein [Mesorhizobium sp. LHD-90]|uniref:bile acid:sodium symporter family protein n=1 Tax=Mesorhizobium sp. LHD-90 TaxID=3071414 RepID=UPI0027E0C80E|nr:bile acid:sodium symporter family protein [Mesorhizobium sp. LHD-90]MDQ6436874.1 bile acid:sodium symporter family protein [Mesorhizobium sp. LHD-90]